MSDTIKFRRYCPTPGGGVEPRDMELKVGVDCAEMVDFLQNVKFEGGYPMRGDKTIVGNALDYSHLVDHTRYALMLEKLAMPSPLARWGTPSKPLTFWQRMERRWDEVKRRVTNAWAALRGDWERDYDY